MLAGAGLGHDATGSETSRHQRLTDCVVDLVGPGVTQILSLE
jgi:hypothetical protein